MSEFYNSENVKVFVKGVELERADSNEIIVHRKNFTMKDAGDGTTAIAGRDRFGVEFECSVINGSDAHKAFLNENPNGENRIQLKYKQCTCI